eukprot:gene10637-12379_t
MLPPQGGFGGAAFLFDLGGAEDQFHQALEGVGAVLFLGAVLLGLEDQYAFAGDAGVAQGQQAFLVEVRQGRGRDVETQVHGAGDLVDVLTASALGADGCQLDLGVGEVHVVGYHQHFLIGPWGGG